MRFKLTLKVDKKAFGNRLPLNYQYELSAFIYKSIARADAQYALWLHENGFSLDGCQFKLFVFSNFAVQQYFVEKENGRLRLESDRVFLSVSFLPEVATEKFVLGLFSEQIFQIGDKKSKVQFLVEKVEIVPPPKFEPVMSFKTIAPVCIGLKKEGARRETFISPDDSEAAEIVLRNLKNKYLAFYGKSFDENFEFIFHATNKPHSKLITLKTGAPDETNIRGFLFDFRMTAPEALMRIAYECGIGEKNSQGFGMIEHKTGSAD